MEEAYVQRLVLVLNHRKINGVGMRIGIVIVLAVACKSAEGIQTLLQAAIWIYVCFLTLHRWQQVMLLNNVA